MNPEQPKPWFRAKEPAEVVRDALAMAVRKRLDGCDPCVEAYLTLARKNGASDQQIAAALQAGEPQPISDGRVPAGIDEGDQ